MSKLEVDAIEPQSGTTLTLGASGDTINVAAGATNNLGITEADQFRLAANLTNPGNTTITANIERVDDSVFSKIGTGMTESSGIFSFPTTGLYLVVWTFAFEMTSTESSLFITQVSNDSGSNYGDVAAGVSGNINASVAYNMGTTFAFVNVTDSSTFRVRFGLNATTASLRLSGNTNYNTTHWTFIRLGDSV